ncbi:MAG TPA: hypothetical protein VJH03_08575 [Blastocatellia bacterium]|nr:hypothetical protein [Blastocatellia bacterium]
MSEEEFVSFWCIYLVSLANEQFLKGSRYAEYLISAGAEIDTFRRACARARIPEITAKKSLRDILEWTLHVLNTWKPKLKYRPPEAVGEWELDLFGGAVPTQPEATEPSSEPSLPKYVNEIKETLEAVLDRSQLSLWLMVDRLDEIFLRRSPVERKALRGLLRAMRYFASGRIRVKVFLRDDMLDQVVRTEDGFTALTHVTVRQADTLRWTPEQILMMLIKRIFANDDLARYLGVEKDQIDVNASYRKTCFDYVFPPTVYRGSNQSPTFRWIYNRCADGRGVVTPRDVLALLIRAKQRQQDLCAEDLDGTSEWIIGSAAIQYGFQELSKSKRQTYLEAEFPHLREHIEKFVGGKTEYDEASLRKLLRVSWKPIAEDLVAVGFFSKRKKAGAEVYAIPVVYWHGLNLTRGRA